jgi:hypothetical protein
MRSIIDGTALDSCASNDQTKGGKVSNVGALNGWCWEEVEICIRRSEHAPKRMWEFVGLKAHVNPEESMYWELALGDDDAGIVGVATVE